MSFRDLYDHCQGLGVPVDVAEIRKAIPRVLPGRRVAVVRSAMNRQRLQGYYLSSRNEDTAFMRGIPAGVDVVVVAEGLEPEWDRFIETKELMHLFDDPLQTTSSAADFESLLAGMCDKIVDGAALSPQMQSELECVWMALGLFCPEELRADLHQKRDSQSVTDADIAAQLRLPEAVVPWLCSPHFKTNLTHLREAKAARG